MKEYNRFTASKRLSRIRPCIRSSYMSLDTIWCRVAYACLEDDSFFQNAHSFYELHYVTNGVQRIGIEDREPVLLNTGDLICIPPHSPHFTQHMNKETEKLVCGFSLSTENDWVSTAMHILCDGNIHSISAQTCEYVTLMLHAAHASAPHTEVSVSHLLEGLFLEIFEELYPESSHIPETVSHEEVALLDSDTRIAEIHRFIHENISYGITSEDVAEHMNISVRHLNRIVYNYEGTTIGKLLNAQKTERIKELLRDPSMTMRMIAERTGFSSEYALGKFFKRSEGMPIGIYRRSMEK